MGLGVLTKVLIIISSKKLGFKKMD